MLEDRKKLLDRNTLFNIRRNRKKLTAYEKAKNLYFLLSVFLSLLIVALFYFLSDFSNIYRITVTGNNHLDKSSVITSSGLSDRSKYLFTMPILVEKRVKENPLIEEAKVELLDHRVVQINIIEKKIVGYVLEAENIFLLTNKDEKISLDKENLALISKVPLIVGFAGEDLIRLEKNLDKCDQKMIDEISEIHNYPDLKYQNVELIMQDGNYIFTSVFGLDILDNYFDIRSSYLSDRKDCYYFEDISGNAYTSACPWEETKKEDEKKDQETVEEMESETSDQ